MGGEVPPIPLSFFGQNYFLVSPVSHFPKKKLEQNLQFNRTFWRVCTIPLSVFVLLTCSTIFLWQEVGQLWRINRICFVFLNLQKARDGKWDGKEFICRRCQSQPDKSSLLGHSGGWHNPWPNVCRRCWGLADKEPNKNEPVPVKSTCQPIKARWENDIPQCAGRDFETKLMSQ